MRPAFTNTSESILNGFRADIDHAGWSIVPNVIGAGLLADLERDVSGLGVDATRGGMRSLFARSSTVRALAASPALRELAESVLGPDCAAVRAIYFDKTPSANWRVPWHQDLTIAVRVRAEVAGYGPWSEKDSIPHVQPPVSVLNCMLALRVHLDDCTASNGPVRVLSGSHRHGRLAAAQIDEWRTRSETTCLAPRGGVLAFRPLLLHASSPADSAAHRRVIHLEYAAAALSAPLEWHDEIRAPTA